MIRIVTLAKALMAQLTSLREINAWTPPLEVTQTHAMLQGSTRLCLVLVLLKPTSVLINVNSISMLMRTHVKNAMTLVLLVLEVPPNNAHSVISRRLSTKTPSQLKDKVNALLSVKMDHSSTENT